MMTFVPLFAQPYSSQGLRFRRGVIVTALISAVCLILVAAAGYFDRDPIHVYPPQGRPRPLVVVNFSGDMGLRFLLGASISRGLTEHGYLVIGISTPVLFGRARTEAEIDAIVADAVRLAIAQPGAKRVVMMGQSYGADIVQTGIARLPVALRRHVAAVVLVLPGEKVFYRADPTGLAYRGTADSNAMTTATTLDWVPLTCIYGVDETDSLCPHLRGHGATLVGMPGGHNIRHDGDGLLAHVLHAVSRATFGVTSAPPAQLP